MSFDPGSIFKHYRIERLIGKGGMGEVYLAEETTLGRKVAIKVLKQEATTNSKFVERFRNEARMLGHLNHPNIVALHTFIEDGGTYYLVMQYAPGITLAELIRKTGPIPELRAMRIFAQLAEALTIAHSEGIVHRDIKPSNIMIDPDKNDRVLVMDFGIARMMDTQHITRTGTQLGTPCYMSPEQVLGKKDVGPPSDIYSAGVVLYEMLSGSLPYDLESESLYTVQGRIVNEPLPDPRLCYEYISDRGVALVKDLTQKEPERRPKDLTAVMRDKMTELSKPEPEPIDYEVEKDQDNPNPSNRRAEVELPDSNSGIPEGMRTTKTKMLVVWSKVFLILLIAYGSIGYPGIIEQFGDTWAEDVNAADAVDEAIPDGSHLEFLRGLISDSRWLTLSQERKRTLLQVVFNRKVVTDPRYAQLNEEEKQASLELYLAEGGISLLARTQFPPKMVNITGGSFMMGSYNGEDNEKPVRKVTVSDYMMGNYEVTQKEWRDIMGSNPSYFKGDDLPVEGVSWYDALDYCNKRSIKEGLTPCYIRSEGNITCNWKANGYRLPTEAEWEYASRRVLESNEYTYSGSDYLGIVAWYGGNSKKTHSVGTKSPNDKGIYDMSGNVWEWCWDWYGFYSGSSTSNPKGAYDGVYKVIRGGSWSDYKENLCSTTYRGRTEPSKRSFINKGFRVVRSIS